MNPYVNFIVPPYHKRKGSSTIFPLGIGYLIASLSMHKVDSKILDFTEKMDDIEEKITESSIDKAVKNFAEASERCASYILGNRTDNYCVGCFPRMDNLFNS